MRLVVVWREHHVEQSLRDDLAQHGSQGERLGGGRSGGRPGAAGLGADRTVEVLIDIEHVTVLLDEASGINGERTQVAIGYAGPRPRRRRQPIHREVSHFDDLVPLENGRHVEQCQDQPTVDNFVRALRAGLVGAFAAEIDTIERADQAPRGEDPQRASRLGRDVSACKLSLTSAA